MTEEQIKSLKKGDKFAVEYTVSKHEDGKVHIKFANGNSDGVWLHNDEVLTQATLVTHPHSFEVGDTVRIIRDPLTGHAHNRLALLDYEIGKEYSITVIDMIGGSACLDGPHRVMSLHCLELVKKAVKDKYIVEEAQYEWRITIDSNKSSFVAAWDKQNYPNAKAAAKAECARLNEAWRKQQEGGAE